MAQSIKLDNDIFWDTSGLYGSNILNNLSNISNNATKVFTVANNFRGILFIFRASSSTSGMYMITSTSSGSVYIYPIVSSSNTTVSSSGSNSVSVANNTGSTIYPCYIGTRKLEE